MGAQGDEVGAREGYGLDLWGGYSYCIDRWFWDGNGGTYALFVWDAAQS